MEKFCSENIKELAGAMLKVQAELEPAVKDAENPFAKNKYATLNSVVLASRGALLKHGLWLAQYPVPAKQGHLGLVTKITHGASGQWQSSLMVMPLSKTDPQGYGSALTYARRYSLAALVGLVTEDDDAESACGRKLPKDAKKRQNGKPHETEELNGRQPDEADSKSDADSELAKEVLKSLPKLDGINYQTIKAVDGQLCVIATGNTAAKKEILSGTGFRWNSERKIWWKYAA
jgi:hypothetical protein